MGTFAPIPMATTSNEADSSPTSVEKLTNLYAEANPGQSKTPVTLYPTPGLDLFASVGDGPIRGIHAMNGHLFVVSGDSIYRITTAGVSTLLGSIGGVGLVRTTDNGTHVAVATSTDLFAVNSSGVSFVTSDTMSSATFQDGYGIFTKKNTQELYITSLDDMTTIDPLDFTTADAVQDNLVGAVSNRRELFLFGEKTTEVFYNSGAAAFPFVRTQSGVIDRGCISAGSIVNLDGTVFFLGDDSVAYVMNGYNPQRISTPSIENFISSSSSPGTAEGFGYTQNGHVFYVLTFLEGTIVFDVTTGSWHYRKSEGIDKWKAQGYANIGINHYVGDYNSSNIYTLNLSTYDENGDTLRREFITPPINGGGNRIFASEIFIDIESGVGLTSGQGSDPQIILDWTDDGGKTYSSTRQATAGAIGVYRNRATFARLGSFYQRSYRVAVSDPVKTAFSGLYSRMDPGQS